MAIGNSVSLTGRAVKDPVCFPNQDGSKKYKWTVAVQHNYKSADGTYGADFIEVEAFVGANAKGDPWSHIQKGTMCQYEGSMRSSNYTDKATGEPVYTQVVSLNAVKFLEPKRAEAEDAAAVAAAEAVVAVEAAAEGGVPMV